LLVHGHACQRETALIEPPNRISVESQYPHKTS